MKQAVGKFCGDFPKPKQPFVSQPFFGHYSRGGGNAGGRNGDQNGAPGTSTDVPGASGPAATTGSRHRHAAAGEHRNGRHRAAAHGAPADAGGTGGGGAGGTGGRGYPPTLYESQPTGGAGRGRDPAGGGRHAARLTPARRPVAAGLGPGSGR